MSFHSLPLLMVSKIVTAARSKLLSKKNEPAAIAKTSVEVRLKTFRFNVDQSDILLNLKLF